MGKRSRLILVICVLAAALGAVVWGAGAGKSRLARLTAQAPAEVTAVEFRRRKSRDVTSIAYRYTAGGRALEGRSSKYDDWTGRLQAGSPGVVCHDPAKPEDGEWFPPGQACPPASSGGP